MKLISLLFFTIGLSSASGQYYDFTDHDFSKADSIALNTPDLDIRNLEQTVAKLTASLTADVDKFQAIYRWIADNISYDTKLYHKNLSKENRLRHQKRKLANWRDKFSKKIYRNLFLNKASVCSGYSLLLEQMCGYVHIEVVTINGYSKIANDRIGVGKIDHAWNAVRLNNKWYLCDPTWSSGFCDKPVKHFTKLFDEKYFLTDPDYFIAQHYPTDKSWTLKFNPPSLNNFLMAPIKLDGFFMNRIVNLEPGSGIVKGPPGSMHKFRFTSNLSDIRNIDVKFFREKNQSVIETCGFIKADDGYYQFYFTLPKKGVYTLKIVINGITSFVYEVRSTF